jgi:NADPH:quinone reductase-like Zn-dependent oxidoreductase
MTATQSSATAAGPDRPSTVLPDTIRAIRQDVLGGPDVLKLRQVPRPKPGPTKVLVRVTAAGVNPLDWKTRTQGAFLGQPPFTVGADVAGMVAALDSGMTRCAVGDRVFGMPRFPGEAAAHAQYLTAPSRQLARTPQRLSDVEAAALPMAALTAWQALVETADVQADQRVLITGAAGGIGHLAVQIAKTRGAYVIGAARAAKHALLAKLGTDETIDYTTQPLGDVARDIDVVLDLAGGQTPLRAMPALRDGGLLIAVTSGGELASEAAGGRVRVTYVLVEPDRVGLEAIAELADSGRLRVHVARTFPLAQAARAHELGETGQTQGKLVLTID